MLIKMKTSKRKIQYFINANVISYRKGKELNRAVGALSKYSFKICREAK